MAAALEGLFSFSSARLEENNNSALTNRATCICACRIAPCTPTHKPVRPLSLSRPSHTFTHVGFSAVCTALGLIKNLAQVEQEYSQALLRAVERHAPKHVPTQDADAAAAQPVRAVLTAALEDSTRRARRHAQLGAELGGSVARALSAETQQSADKRRALVTSGERSLRLLHERHSAVRAASEACHSARRAASEEMAKLERVINTPRVKDRERKKAHDRSEAATAKLTTAAESLRAAEASALAAQGALFDEEMPALLRGFERQEEQRAAALLDAGTRLHTATAAAAADAAECASRLVKSLQTIDPELETGSL
jgi:hypothetical protein